MNQTSHSHSHPQQEHNSSANAVGTTGSDKSARTLIKRWFLLSALLHGSTWSPCQQLHACSASVGIVICHQNHRNSKSLETASINSVSLKARLHRTQDCPVTQRSHRAHGLPLWTWKPHCRGMGHTYWVAPECPDGMGRMKHSLFRVAAALFEQWPFRNSETPQKQWCARKFR